MPDTAAQELCVALDEELNRLPERYRAPLLLCYLEGCTSDRAARQLGWSLRTPTKATRTTVTTSAAV